MKMHHIKWYGAVLAAAEGFDWSLNDAGCVSYRCIKWFSCMVFFAIYGALKTVLRRPQSCSSPLFDYFSMVKPAKFIRKKRGDFIFKPEFVLFQLLYGFIR